MVVICLTSRLRCGTGGVPHVDGRSNAGGCVLWLFPNKFVSNPHDERVAEVVDRPDQWRDLLAEPQVVDDDGKSSAPVLCGAKYFPEAKDREKENIESVTCLVLDVDCSATPAGRPPTGPELRNAVKGLKAIGYTSPSHTKRHPRWRLLLPLAAPLPPKKHRALVQNLSDVLVPGFAGCIDVSSTGDPGRLGYVMCTKDFDDYDWFVEEGERLDWRGLVLADETWVKGVRGGLERSPFWTDRKIALQAALRHFGNIGQGKKPGDGRTNLLHIVSCQTWWEWAAEDDDFVLEVMEHVNGNFSVPEDGDEILRQLDQGHRRAIGERRKEQVTGAYGWRRDRNAVSSEEALKVHARRLRNRRKIEDSQKGEALRRVIEKLTPHDEVSMWKGLLTKLAHELAQLFPYETAERLAGYFESSTKTMLTKDSRAAVSLEEIRGWIGARLEKEQKRRAENMARGEEKTRGNIEAATGGLRDTRYTQNEVEMWKQSVGLRDNNWILVSKNTYYVFCNGTWKGPYNEREFEAQGYKDLDAAYEVGVRTFKLNEEKGERVNLSIAKIVHEYGTSCKTRIDLNCEKAWFDVHENELVLAGPARRPLQARFHPEVDQWFRVMTGKATPTNLKQRQDEAALSLGEKAVDDYDKICDWLACLLQLDTPCAALYLMGVNSVGKGLFAEGVGRLWKRGPMGLEDAFADYNSMLADTPYVWVDENALPEKVKASVLLRKALAAREFIYNRKYHDTSKVTGCLRMLLTANNLDLFNKQKEMVRREDVDALALRFVHVNVRPEAIAYLESLNPRHGDFVEKDMIAEHALWLAEKRWATIKARGTRFLVKGRNTNVSDIVATNSDSTAECCIAICDALAEKRGRGTDWLMVKDHEVFVSASLLKRHLGLMGSSAARQISEVEITRAVSSISEGPPKVVWNGKPQRMRKIRLQTLKAWCDYKEVFVWSDVEAGIDEMSKQTPGGPTQGGPPQGGPPQGGGGFSASTKIVN